MTYAATRYWIGGTDNWYSNNWFTQIPVAGDSAKINNGGTVQVTSDVQGVSVYLESGSTIQLSNGSISVSNVDHSSFQQSGGTATLGRLAYSSYLLSNGTFSMGMFTQNFGTTFTQTGGTSTFEGGYDMGWVSGGQMDYYISGGTMNIVGEYFMRTG